MCKSMKSIFIAVLATVLTTFFITLMVTYIDSVFTENYGYQVSLMMSGVAALVSLVITMFWALPFHLLFKRRNKNSYVWYILIAVVPSVGFIYILKPFGHDTALTLFFQALFCSFVGVVAAMVFWYFAVFKVTHNKPLKQDF